ncbi:MAG: sulfatase-like hydrolase/transferase [Verrucomicrobiota bacterium]
MKSAVIISLVVFGVSLFGEDHLERPNMVFMFADDLGFADLGCYGHPYARTPHLDGLANEGTRFTRCYVTGVTCNPSRTGLMTGLFPARFENYSADFGFGDRVAVTEILSQAGYRTGHFGKWHIGPVSEHGTYGIDQVEIIGKSKGKNAGRDDDVYSAAIEFIRANQEGPFYVNVWGHSTHFPVATAPILENEFADVSVDRSDFSATMQPKFDECLEIGGDLDVSMRQYLGDVYSIDQNVGRLLKVLEELGLVENTIVIFSSDHGPAPVTTSKGAREFSQNMLGYAGPFRGGKHTQYEGGTRVPFIIRWPGEVEAGRVDDTSVISLIDWMPTLASIAGVTGLPSDLDGEDVSDIWRGVPRPREMPLFWKASSSASAPAMISGSWKFHGVVRKRHSIALYNLDADPAEQDNVAADNPEIVSELSSLLESWVSALPTEYYKSPETR